MFKTYFLYHQNAHFILEGVVTTFQVYIIIVFFMTTMVNMLTKSENFKKSKNNKKICNHMPRPVAKGGSGGSVEPPF